MQTHSHCRSMVHAVPMEPSRFASFSRSSFAEAWRNLPARSTRWPDVRLPSRWRWTPQSSRGFSLLLSLVRAQVADAILAHGAPAIQADLIRLLARPGYALDPQGPCRA